MTGRASKVQVVRCGGCDAVHLLLLDAAGAPFAEAALTAENARLVADELTTMANRSIN